MKKKHLKTFLYFEDNKVANNTVLYAAKMNAEQNPIGINYLYSYAMTLKTVGREEDTQVELIGNNALHIDAKINGIWENVLRVEEVEVFEPVRENYFEDDEMKAEILAASKYPL